MTNLPFYNIYVEGKNFIDKFFFSFFFLFVAAIVDMPFFLFFWVYILQQMCVLKVCSTSLFY